jgi:hypothetical protein
MTRKVATRALFIVLMAGALLIIIWARMLLFRGS